MNIPDVSKLKISTKSSRNDDESDRKITEEGTIERPFIRFTGKIHYFTSFVDCAQACDSLLTRVESSSGRCVLGFDLEWPFSFQNGAGKAALVQICADEGSCYLLHLIRLQKLPAALIQLLGHSRVRLAGVAVKNDVRKLCKDFSISEYWHMTKNCIDARVQANKVFKRKESWSMERLVDILYDMRINKNRNVRCGKWDVVPLNEEQKLYAATDAYVSLLIHNSLEEKRKEDESLSPVKRF